MDINPGHIEKAASLAKQLKIVVNDDCENITEVMGDWLERHFIASGINLSEENLQALIDEGLRSFHEC